MSTALYLTDESNLATIHQLGVIWKSSILASIHIITHTHTTRNTRRPPRPSKERRSGGPTWQPAQGEPTGTNVPIGDQRDRRSRTRSEIPSYRCKPRLGPAGLAASAGGVSTGTVGEPDLPVATTPCRGKPGHAGPNRGDQSFHSFARAPRALTT